MSRFCDLVEICKGHRVVIQTHNFPDPDAIAAAASVQYLLRQFNVESELAYDGKIDHISTQSMLSKFSIVMCSYDSICDSLTEEDYIICVDSQKHGGNITDFVGNEIACIDHHPVYVKYKYLYKDIRKVGACSSIIASYFRDMSIVPSAAIATALSYGIKMDTLQLSRGVTLFDLEMFTFLFPFANIELLNSLERNVLELRDLEAYKTAISSIEIYGNVGFVRVNYDLPDGMIAILSDFILSLIEVEISIAYSERKSGFKFSIRSEDFNIDAGELIRIALDGVGSGGGHSSMAGGFIPRENISEFGATLHKTIVQSFLNALTKVRRVAV